MSVLLRTDDLKLEKQEHGLKFKTALAIKHLNTVVQRK